MNLDTFQTLVGDRITRKLLDAQKYKARLRLYRANRSADLTDPERAIIAEEVILGKFDYTTEKNKLEKISKLIEQITDILDS